MLKFDIFLQASIQIKNFRTEMLFVVNRLIPPPPPTTVIYFQLQTLILLIRLLNVKNFISLCNVLLGVCLFKTCFTRNTNNVQKLQIECNYAASQHCCFVPCAIFFPLIQSLLDNEQSDIDYMYYYSVTCNLYKTYR